MSGMSLATVSRVLSGSDYAVSEPSRRAVLSAAKKLRYMPNALGKSLKTSSTREIGVVIPNITNPYYALLLQGIQDAAAQREYHILLCNSNRDAGQEARDIHSLLAKRVDGILLASISQSVEAVQYALDIGCTLITMEQELPIRCIHVGFDYRAGSWMATKHLIDKGHRRIAFIGAPPSRHSRQQMLAGYRQCLAEHALPVDERMIQLSETENESQSIYEMENGAACAAKLLENQDRPTAFVCLNDMTAIGAMRALSARGFRVPQDVSVIGFDNIPFCEVCDPPLTTIDQHAYAIGEMSTKLIIERIENEDANQCSLTLQPTLVERRSTSSPA